VPAETVWGGKQLPLYLRRTKSGARQYLLAALGAASAIYAPVEESLLSAQPSAVELSTQQAYEFLSQQAVMLQQAGFAVMLPGWWARSRRKLRAGMVEKNSTLQVKSDKLSMDTLVDFEWQVALGDQTMSRRELEELARLKVPLVRVRGEWVELTPEQLEAALKLASKPKQKMALRNVIQVAFGAEPAGGLPFAGIESGGVVSSLLNQLSAGDNFQPLPAPQQFHGELRPYQQRGYAWLDFLSRWGMGACLADDMGLGKTVQTLALLQRNWHSWPAAERLPVLLVCPTSVIGNWKNEVQKFTPDLPVLIHHGSARQKRQAFITEAQNYALVITSYALLVKDTDALTQVGWAGVILDEAQNIKKSETKMAKAARQLPAQFKIALTGTPVENHLGDLWSIMEFLNPGLLGTASAFRKNFIVPVQIDRDADALERLHRITRPFILRRVKTDKEIIRDLPEKLETKDFCSLTREQTTLYKAVLREMEDRLASADKEIERKGVVLATIGKLKQICNHPALFLHDKSSLAGRSGKLARLTSMLDECLQEGDCTLIFTQFAEMGELLKQYLQDSFGEEVLFLHGDVPQKRRQEMIERFQQADGPRLFVLSLKAGGVGLNLTRANQVFHFDRWWNPAVENQATDRAYRIGQQRTVHVHKFICSGTMEEKIDSLIESKQEIAQLTVGVGESWLTNLSDKQLREVLALSREALQE
jgi:SNF2 family DNA or RNA helicase